MDKLFGDRLKELRKERNLTQEELGNLMNSNKASISHYESNRRMPDAYTIANFADFFNVTVDYILGRSDKKDGEILENDDLPKELKKIGIEYLEVNKELKKKGLSPEDILDIIQALERAGLTKDK